jgi:hypothetical protein
MRPAMITLCSRALSALLLALACASAARAEPIDATADAPQQQMDDEPVPPQGDEPLDLSIPVVAPRVGKATIPFARPGAGSGWDAKVGVDYRKPSIPAAEFQPGELTAGAIPDQSTGVAWANVIAPGFDSPLGWDKTAIETRLDPAQEQGKLGATLSRSVPLGASVALTLQNGYSVTRAHPDAGASATQKLGDPSGAAAHLADRHQPLTRRGDLEHGRQVAAHLERRAEAVRRSAQRHRLGQRDRERRRLEEPEGRLQADVVEASIGRGR